VDVAVEVVAAVDATVLAAAAASAAGTPPDADERDHDDGITLVCESTRGGAGARPQLLQ
jgi:hypothetical protein